VEDICFEYYLHTCCSVVTYLGITDTDKYSQDPTDTERTLLVRDHLIISLQSFNKNKLLLVIYDSLLSNITMVYKQYLFMPI